MGIIRRLTIDRYRGIKRLAWNPGAGLNVILGGGDVGKSTVLEAIAHLLSPSNAIATSEIDYYQRDVAAEFCIEAIIKAPGSLNINTQPVLAFPWAWDGSNAVQPDVPHDGADELMQPGDPVYRVRVRGTGELELVWEIVQPNGEVVPFSVALRREIGIVRLPSDDRNDRDLRLVYGSALDRLLSDTALRSRIGQLVAETNLQDALNENAQNALGALDARLAEAALPSGITLGLTTSQGLSIGALIGLLAKKEGISLPLSSWGAGTRRMAALAVASQTGKEASVTTIDEIERGLEPYRLRTLIRDLSKGSQQGFVTTHNPVAIACATEADLWYLDHTGTIGALAREKIATQQLRDPETFLAKIPVLCEGKTEVGFLGRILQQNFTGPLLDFGLRVCDGHGNDTVLGLIEALSSAGLRFATFVDDEGRDPGRWAALKAKLGDALFQWPGGSTEANVIAAYPEDRLPELCLGGDGQPDGQRLRTIADRLGSDNKSWPAITKALHDKGQTLKQVMIAAAIGNIENAPEGREKEWKAHARAWFKSIDGGQELATKLMKTSAWATIGSQLLPLVNYVRASAGLPALAALSA